MMGVKRSVCFFRWGLPFHWTSHLWKSGKVWEDEYYKREETKCQEEFAQSGWRGSLPEFPGLLEVSGQSFTDMTWISIFTSLVETSQIRTVWVSRNHATMSWDHEEEVELINIKKRTRRWSKSITRTIGALAEERERRVAWEKTPPADGLNCQKSRLSANVRWPCRETWSPSLRGARVASFQECSLVEWMGGRQIFCRNHPFPSRRRELPLPKDGG